MVEDGVVADLIYDVGLHRGEDAAFYLALGYRVRGFEADPDLVAACRVRFARELSSGQFTVVEGAIDATSDSAVPFYRHSATSLWGTTDARWVERNRTLGESIPVHVPTVDFGASLRATGVPYYMKVDIEGADELCFDALRACAHRPTYVSLESTKTGLDGLMREFALLEELGYNRFAVVQQDGIERRERTVTNRQGDRLRYGFEPGSSGPFGSDIGPWLSREAALARYHFIFRQYRWFGDRSLIHRVRALRRMRDIWSKVRGISLPGWYDTHATRSST